MSFHELVVYEVRVTLPNPRHKMLSPEQGSAESFRSTSYL